MPILSGGTFCGGRSPISSVLDAGAVLHVPAGRIALALALRDIDLRPGDKVLVPAYHCPAMIAPIVWASARPVFCRVRPDLALDLDDVRGKLDERTRALIVVHYFGFAQDLTAIGDLCRTRGLVLIEDCAHSFFGDYEGRPLGSFGDYAIASTMKFFPVYDGGCLISSCRSVDRIAVESIGAAASAKAAINIVERALRYRRLKAAAPLLGPVLGLKDVLWRRAKERRATSQTIAIMPLAAELSDDDSGDFEPEYLHKGASLPSRLVLRLASKRRITDRRRKNFAILLEGLSDLPGCRPLFQTLPEGTVPFAFPVLFDDAESAYDALDRELIPIPHFGKYLWPGVDVATCPVSVDYSRRLLQFPCHQELTAKEIAWLIERFRHAMLSLGSAAREGGGLR